MISPQSNIEIINQVRFFNVSLNSSQKSAVFNILKPIQSLLDSHSQNSIYVFRDGDIVHAEAFIHLNNHLSKTQSIGNSIQEVISKLVPEAIRNISSRSTLGVQRT